MATTIKLVAKPTEFEAIKWENNEAEIRDFIKDDKLLKFPIGKMQLWDGVHSTWSTIPMGHFLAKSKRGGLISLSPEEIENDFSPL